jgi:ATP-dependent Clp protease ATP-binding subunit ClpB
VDEIIIFHSLTEKQIELIAELQLKEVEKHLQEKKITLRIDTSVKKYLAKEGYNPDFGARPLKRVIQNEILDALALMIIEGKVKEGQTVEITVERGKIVIK